MVIELDDARRMCNGEGGYLAIVNSPGEAEFLQTLMNYYPISCISDADKLEAFIGIHDYFQAGRYVTIDGRNIEKSGYQYWNDGEPNNIGDERCGAIYRFNGRLNNLRCHDKHTYICEYKRPPGGVVVLG
ncbi:hemolymph lipopolysaccharide-binding protein-like [Chrysoperla carnea]|uniref:hemolymph lipopolysaccharide-binding protein-like n=1 Tax=Chrysoperla carnea TaxID=189513 RepID=UPI001D081D35|nr:hemolymph lipopolysaccharide-binding protein-like [Chrysoperla carnea]